MLRKIERVTAGELEPGEFMIAVDDEKLVTTDEITASYLWDEQDWQRVVARTGRADTGQLVLAYYNGETYTSPVGSWDQFVWRLVEADGQPVRHED